MFLIRFYLCNVKNREKPNRNLQEETMELSLDSGSVFIPKTISGFLAELSEIRDNFEKLLKLDDYVKRLEEEMRKIDAFKRELPLSMLLLNDAIGRLKEETALYKKLKDGSFTEELIPLKRNSDEDEKVNLKDDSSDKRNWLSSVQLWNTNIDYDFRKQDCVSELKLRNEKGDRSVPENPVEICNNGQSGSGLLLRSNKKEDKEASQVPNLSLKPPFAELSGPNILNSKNTNSCRGGSGSSFIKTQEKIPNNPQNPLQQPQSLRKQRRCWSPELHRRFIDALQQLGGSQVATPKQIRDIMQVEGLTNDEVKSHLQKYRLHVRKLPPLSTDQDSSCLWMSQNQLGDHSKADTSHSQSGSPQGPLLVGGSGKGLSSTSGGDSMETEEDEIKSDGHSWNKGSFNRSRVENV